MKQVTADEWADFCSDFWCRTTEGPLDGIMTMTFRHHISKEMVGQVVYRDEGPEYWINPECTAPKMMYWVDEDGNARRKEV